MDTFFENLLVFVFWGSVVGIILLVIAMGIKTPEPKPLPPGSPTRFVGRAKVIEPLPAPWTPEETARAQRVLEYVNGPTSTRKAS